MFEPIRGGTRGGQGEFKWSDVSADKDREVRCRCPITPQHAHAFVALPWTQCQCTYRTLAEEQGRPLVQP